MGIAEPGPKSTDGDVAEFDHWIYGAVWEVGYTTKAFSQGLDVGLYDPYLRGHYTPIRGAAIQATEGEIDLHMIHPVRAAREILLSRITRGPADEAGRPTFTNHTVVVRTEGLQSGRITLDAVYRAVEDFDRAAADVDGEMGLLRVPMRSDEEARLPLGNGIHRHLTLPALETVATRMMTDSSSRTFLLSRNSTPEARNRTLHLLFELLGWACGLPLFNAISDAPRSSAMNAFNLVVAPRGVRADSTWSILESALAQSVLPRVLDRDDVYEALTATFRQSAEVTTPTKR